MSNAITGAMVAWDEEKIVDLAIRSALSVVDDWTFVIRGDETIAKVEECIKKFGLEVSYFEKETMGPDERGLPVAEARFRTFDNAKGDWILICDGDQIFHTDGEYSVDGVKELVKGERLIHGWPLVHLYFDFHHMAVGKNGPLLIPHKQLYPNDKGTGWSMALPGRDLPYGKAKRTNHNDWFMIFNCSIKCYKRYFRRLYKQSWQQERADFKMPLDEWIVENYGIEDIDSAAANWAKRKMKNLMPYHGKWGLPKVIREDLRQGNNRRMYP